MSQGNGPLALDIYIKDTTYINTVFNFYYDGLSVLHNESEEDSTIFFFFGKPLMKNRQHYLHSTKLYMYVNDLHGGEIYIKNISNMINQTFTRHYINNFNIINFKIVTSLTFRIYKKKKKKKKKTLWYGSLIICLLVGCSYFYFFS